MGKKWLWYRVNWEKNGGGLGFIGKKWFWYRVTWKNGCGTGLIITNKVRNEETNDYMAELKGPGRNGCPEEKPIPYPLS